MKHIKTTILSAFFFICLVFVFFSCDKNPINGNLDERWQMMTIEYHQTDSIAHPSYTYWDFYLHLLEFRNKLMPTDEILTGTYYGRFIHTPDSLTIRMIQCSKTIAAQFGMADTIQHFKVETLTHKRMVLDSKYSRLTFRKF